MTLRLKANTSYNDYAKSAQNLLKSSINVGEAIVNILSHTGIAGFKFHVPKSEQVNMESEITDHYIDTGSAIQDHVARKPITITVNGFQGEYFYSAYPIESMLAAVVPTLALVKQFLPKLRGGIKLTNKSAVNNNAKTAAQSESLLEKNIYNHVDLFKLFQEIYKLKSAQTRAFLYFEALWRSEATFTVETTWKRYDNMIIQKITPLRDNNADITDFSITFKQLSFAESKSEKIKNAAGRLKAQNAEVTKKGVDKGKEVKAV